MAFITLTLWFSCMKWHPGKMVGRKDKNGFLDIVRGGGGRTMKINHRKLQATT